MPTNFELIADLPSDTPAIAMYDLGSGEAWDDFDKYTYRQQYIAALLQPDRQVEPEVLNAGRFEMTGGRLVPRGILRETMLGKWHSSLKILGYEHIGLFPHHHDKPGFDRPIEAGTVTTDNADEAYTVSASVHEILASDAELRPFIIVGEQAIKSFLRGFSDANNLAQQATMPHYQHDFYLPKVDSEMRAAAVMAHMAGTKSIIDVLPEEHRYRVLVQLASFIARDVALSRVSLDVAESAREAKPLNSERRHNVAEYLFNHPFRNIMRGSQENVYYQIEPIISAYEIHEDILLETVFRLWLMHNQFHDLPRAAPFFERDKWGILYEGEAFMEWKKQFYVSPDVSLAETYAASMSKQELQNYRRIVRATALAAMGRDFIDEVPDIFRHSYFLEQDKIEKSKPVHQPKR